ncbi:chemotaxis protein CheA [Allochromatium vinosum]|uniref:Chemotaxis protein CheA n=1 Tax=Allochromatium vinosum (strain ATCC 17899 / DSM 180 / NBRC 103801 / NCIMB 10441 / D) TaxID=572477 RepID=D3RRB1_ALLVD|nr:chemotaxis protein CheA [Allochromatium vinosum]ADC63823.1 CheA signal transduction histidine kinase [Allochromatium vinosum DSM 180]
MAIDPNDEILQDFLVEAGELLEALNEQLIDLEQNPNDRDLLNAVFRSFHTIKGGAGFLNLNALVVVCHHAEDVFNLLRNGERRIDPVLMDVVLRVLDVLNVMFGDLKSAREPEPAPPALIADLAALAVPDAAGTSAPEPAPEPVPEPPPVAESEPLSARPPEPTPAPAIEAGSTAESADEITEAEFEALLDALSGQPAESASIDRAAVAPEPLVPAPPAEPPGTVSVAEEATGANDLITDDEFESLLDQLHGSGAAKPVETPKPSPLPVPSRPAASASLQPPVPAADPFDTAKAQRAAAVPAGETSVRVDTQRLDEIMNLVGELVLVRNRLSMLRVRTGDEEIGKAIASLALVTSDLQAAVMKTRMQPVKKVFSRFPRVVRDLARNLGKEIELETFGEETDLDKNLVEALADPLVHLIRNAVDHGIEMPDEREAKGKPRRGTVVLGAAQEGDHISLLIQDDGRGMDPEKLRAKSVEKGLLDPSQAERLSTRECFDLIFMAGFSTKEEISDVSGRGVGMDVVKTRIAQLNGTVEIDSKLGVGTKLNVKLPLTLAILPALMVILDGRRFAIPLASVSEILDLDLTRTHFVDDQEAIMVRNHALPLYYASRWLHPYRLVEPKSDSHVVVVHVAQRKIGLVVDDLVGQEEVVIKPLGKGLHGVPGLAGATITGDGGIALIIDIPALVRLMSQPGYGGRASHAQLQPAETGMPA